jgi:tetratricopeptide (TPR) repeat protein
MATSSKPPRDQAEEDSIKPWLGVLIAFVTLLIGGTTFLEIEVSSRAAECAHHAKENDIASTSLRTRGMLETTFGDYVMHEYDQLMDQANTLRNKDRLLEASAYVTAAKEIARKSPVLAAPYTIFDVTGWRRLTDNERFDVDTWVVSATLKSERSKAETKMGDAWSSKSNNYKTAIVVFAVVLFLLALATILSGCSRWLFVSVGVGLAALVSLWVLLATLLPVPNIPDAALQQYAEGYGYTWRDEYDQAIQSYSRAIALYPDYARALAGRGQAWFHTQPPDIKKAVQDLKAASQHASDDYNVFWNLGWGYYLTGDYAQSMAASQKSLALNPKICGSAFNIALARLAMGDTKQAEKDYEAAIARCEKIVREYREAGGVPPSRLWQEINASAEDIENLLCQTHQQYCYKDRARHDVKVANRAAVLTVGEKYRKRIKEVLTALEALKRNAASIQPTGARFDPLVFGNKFYNDADEFQSYVLRERFPYNGAKIYALWNYWGVKPEMETTYKVYRDGTEKPDLRYAGKWGLANTGGAEKKINSWFIMPAGRYDVEVYGDGELLTTGSFDIDDKETLTVPLAGDARPNVPVNVGNLVFYEDFANNHHGWWTGNANADPARLNEGTIRDGEYLIVTHKKDVSWRVTCEDCGNLDDVYFEANTRYVRGSATYPYGLVLRGDRGVDQTYLFSITADGSYRVAKDVEDKIVPLASWTSDPVIRPNGTNRLGVLARGSSFEFFINGKSVARVNDTSLSKGYIGFSVGITDLEVAFSQVRVWQVR